MTDVTNGGRVGRRSGGAGEAMRADETEILEMLERNATPSRCKVWQREREDYRHRRDEPKRPSKDEARSDCTQLTLKSEPSPYP